MKPGTVHDAQAQALACVVLEIETMFGYAVDVEFAFSSDSHPWIVQARPVTTAAMRASTASARPDGVVVVEVEDVVAATKLATGTPAKLLASRTDKRHYVRLAARRQEFTMAGEWLIAPPGDSTEDWVVSTARCILELARTDVLEIAFPAGPLRRSRRSDVDELLRSAGDPNGTIFVSELPVAEACGFAAVRDDGAMVVEYLPGAAGGLMFGSGPFSQIVVASNGEIVVDEVRTASSYWAMDPTSLQIREIKLERTPEPLTHAHLRALRQTVDGMAAELGDVRVEWLRLLDDSVMLWDLTVEEGGPLSAKGTAVVSPGRARGRAVVLTDLSELERILDDRSVIADQMFFEAHGSDEAVQVRERVLNGIEQPIVVAPFPKTTLALLLGHVRGFVFDSAATLAHLPIILREQNVPAIRVANATSIVRTGDEVEIDADGLRPIS